MLEATLAVVELPTFSFTAPELAAKLLSPE